MLALQQLEKDAHRGGKASRNWFEMQKVPLFFISVRVCGAVQWQRDMLIPEGTEVRPEVELDFSPHLLLVPINNVQTKFSVCPGPANKITDGCDKQ